MSKGYDRIVDRFFKDICFETNEKINRYYQYKEAVNSAFNRIEGRIFVPDWWRSEESVILFLLEERNESKIITDICRAPYVREGLRRISSGLFYEITSVLRVKRTGKAQYTLMCGKRSLAKYVLNLYRRMVLGARTFDFDNALKEKYNCAFDQRIRDLGITYDDAYRDIKMFYECDETHDQRMYAKFVFADFIFLRDFINAEKWIKKINELCIQDPLGLELYNSFWKETQDYINGLRYRITGKEHVVVNWIDAMRYMEQDDTVFIKHIAQHGIMFENMYSSTPYTTATMRGMLKGKLLIDDKLYLENVSEYRWDTICDSRLISVLRRYGYSFMYFGNKFLGEVFENPDLNPLIHMVKDDSYLPSPVLQFKMAEVLAEANDKVFCIVHNLNETHDPFDSPFVKKKDASEQDFATTDKRIRESLCYLDDQLEYYAGVYNGAKRRVYFSDHGKLLPGESFNIESLHHVVFLVTGEDILRKRIRGVYSLIEFSAVVRCLLSGEDIPEKRNEALAYIQMDDAYGEKALCAVRAGETDPHKYMQYRGIITDRGSFVRFAYGREYYEKDGVGVDLSEVDQDLIVRLKNLIGDKYINIYKEKKYRKSLSLYKAINLAVGTKGK